MKTICIQIGNSDNKLTQQEWSEYVQAIRELFTTNCTVHFFGGSTNYEKWQNVCWVIELEERYIKSLKIHISTIGKHFKQDSVAYFEGSTEFI